MFPGSKSFPQSLRAWQPLIEKICGKPAPENAWEIFNTENITTGTPPTETAIPAALVAGSVAPDHPSVVQRRAR